MAELVNLVVEEASTNIVKTVKVLDNDTFDNAILLAVSRLYEGEAPQEIGISTKDGQSIEKTDMTVQEAVNLHGNHLIIGRPNDLG